MSFGRLASPLPFEILFAVSFVRTNPEVTYENSSSLLRASPKSCAILMPFAVSSVSIVTASSRSECLMMKTAFSPGARPRYTSATVAKPSLSRTISGEALTIADEDVGSIDDDISGERCPSEEGSGKASDDKAAEDHSGESCADDPPNIFQELGISESEEQDSIIDVSDCDDEAGSAEPADSGPEEESESPHAANTASTETLATAAKDANCMRITNPTGSRPPHRQGFRH